MDLVQYYLAVAEGALRGAGGRPMALKRFVNGAAGEFFFQKRAPEKRPQWVDTVSLSFPSGRTAEEIVLRDATGVSGRLLRAMASIKQLRRIDLRGVSGLDRDEMFTLRKALPRCEIRFRDEPR